MRKVVFALCLLGCLFTLGCGPQLDDECDKLHFDEYCSGNNLVFCNNEKNTYDPYVDQVSCGSAMCTSLLGIPGCYYTCDGKVGDVTYKCKDSKTLIKQTCIAGDGGVVLASIEEINCVGSSCVSSGTSAGCEDH